MNNTICHIADRVHLIGVETMLWLLSQLKQVGINAVSLSQHESGNQSPELVTQMKTVLKHCEDEEIQVYIAAMNGSKWTAGSPTGFLVEKNFQHSPPHKLKRIDRDRVACSFFCKGRTIYQFTFLTNEPCTIHLMDGTVKDWQLIKYANVGPTATLEFASLSGGNYELVFKGDKIDVQDFSIRSVADPESLSQTLNEWGKIEGRTFESNRNWYYRGGEGITGNGFIRTPNYADFASRREARKQTLGFIVKTYGEFFGNPIVGTYLKWDEFAGLGDLCNSEDMLRDMQACAVLSETFIGPALVDARVGEFGSYCRYNKPHAGRIGFNNFWKCDSLIHIAWEEETTPDICDTAKLFSHPDALAGVYLGKGNPQHFVDAGFTQAAIYWWPRDGATWRDMPFDKVREVVEAFRQTP